MFPSIPEDPQAFNHWVDMFGKAYHDTFNAGLRFEPKASSSDAIVFDKDTSTEAPIVLVPKPPLPRFLGSALTSRDTYQVWCTCFGPLLNTLRTIGFSYVAPPMPPPSLSFSFPPKPLVSTVDDSLLPFYHRYFGQPHNRV